MKPTQLLVLTLSIGAALCLSSCGGEQTTSSDTDHSSASKPKAGNAPNASILKVGDKLFNLPSPLETAFLIEEVGGHFNEAILNRNTDASGYSTKQSQAMNLGIYGADLGYSLIYGHSQSSFTLLATCKRLGTDLGISPAVYTGLMGRFEGNLQNRDSLLIFVSELNRMSDEYLKENESEDISALILYGGWVESLYFSTVLTQELDDEKLRNRVGEQKNTLGNMVGLIEQQNVDGALDNIVTQLKELEVIFENVGDSYTWVEPQTNPEEHMTVIKSQSSVEVSPEVLAEITAKIDDIRNSIIGSSES